MGSCHRTLNNDTVEGVDITDDMPRLRISLLLKKTSYSPVKSMIYCLHRAAKACITAIILVLRRFTSISRHLVAKV